MSYADKKKYACPQVIHERADGKKNTKRVARTPSNISDPQLNVLFKRSIVRK